MLYCDVFLGFAVVVIAAIYCFYPFSHMVSFEVGKEKFSWSLCSLSKGALKIV